MKTMTPDIWLEAGESVAVPTASAMRELGKRCAAQSGSGNVIALYGDLGTGKTEFVRGFADEMEVQALDVGSPTFTLIHEYEGRLPIHHFDAYRVKDPQELVDMDLDDYLFGSGICLIEWPEIIEHLLPDDVVRLQLEHQGDGSRLVTRRS